MNRSEFYAVRFSPAPELGEWLNIAIVGQGISEKNAGIAVTDSMDRIEAAFGQDAVERVKDLCDDLNGLVAEMLAAQKRGEETQPIPTALKDLALSVAFSDRIMVFELKFDEALAMVAKKYLTGPEDIVAGVAQAAAQTDLIGAIQKKFRELLPPPVPKRTDQAAAGRSLRGSTVLLVGDADDLETVLIGELLSQGARVRIFDSSKGAAQVLEIVEAGAKPAISIKDVANKSGMDLHAVSHVLLGGAGKVQLPKGAIDRIKDVADSLGFQLGNRLPQVAGHDVVPSDLDGVEAVVYLSEAETPRAEVHSARMAVIREAKAKGAQRMVLTSTYRVYGKGRTPVHEGAPLHPETALGRYTAQLESELLQFSDEKFGVTTLRFGELYGYPKTGTQVVKAPPAGRPATANALVSRAVLEGKVSVTDTAPLPFLHVEDATRSIIAVLGAPAESVFNQTYNVGAESEHRTFGQIASRVKASLPEASIVIAAAELESGSCLLMFSKLSEHLSFRPQRTVEEGIDSAVAALQAAKASLPPPEPGAGGKEVEQPELTIDWNRLGAAKVDAEGQPTTEQSIRKKSN